MKTTDKNVVVIYHKNCWDGLGAAWAAWRNFGGKAKYIPFAYHDPMENLVDITGKDVFIVDFSFKKDILLDMHRKAKRVVVLDHHASAKEDLEGLDFCTFDMSRSGALMTWNFFFPEHEAPEIIKMISDRDLWKFEIPASKPFQAYLTTMPYEFSVLDDIFDGSLNRLSDAIGQGEAIIRFQDLLVKNAVKASVPVIMFDKEVHMCQSSPGLSSEIGEALARKSRDGIGCAYTIGKDTGVSLSFRGCGDADVIPLARHFGGGGHRKAGGGKTDLDTFYAFMKSGKMV